VLLGIRLFCFLVVGVLTEVRESNYPIEIQGFCSRASLFTEGAVTDSQLFPFTAGKTSIQLAPENQKGATCLVPAGAKLGSAACSSDAGQLFTIA